MNSRKFVTKHTSEYIKTGIVEILTTLQYSAINEMMVVKAITYSHYQEILATFTITAHTNCCEVGIVCEIDDIVDFNNVINALYEKFLGVPPLLRSRDKILPPILELIHFAHYNYPELSMCRHFYDDYGKLYDIYKEKDQNEDELITTIKMMPDINELFHKLLLNDELFNLKMRDITNNDSRLQSILICKHSNNIQLNVRFIEFVANYAHTAAFNFTNWMYLIEIIKLNKSVLPELPPNVRVLIYTQLHQHTMQTDYRYKLLIDAIYELNLF